MVHLIRLELQLPEEVLTEEGGLGKEMALASFTLGLGLPVDLIGRSPLPKAGKGLHSFTAELTLEAAMDHRDSQVVRKMLAFTLGIQEELLHFTKAGDPLASFMLDSDMLLCCSASAWGSAVGWESLAACFEMGLSSFDVH